VENPVEKCLKSG